MDGASGNAGKCPWIAELPSDGTGHGDKLACECKPEVDRCTLKPELKSIGDHQGLQRHGLTHDCVGTEV